ncbi:hypothetical protein IC582_004672 [Cucumis melo]
MKSPMLALVLVSLTFFFFSFPNLSTSAAQRHPLPSLYHTRIVPLLQPSRSSLLPSYEYELQARRRRRRLSSPPPPLPRPPPPRFQWPRRQTRRSPPPPF